MGVQVEAVAGGDGEAVEMGYAKDEGAGPISEAARGGAEGASGLEEARVDVGGHGIAQDGAKSAAHHVGAFAPWEVDLIEGAEMEPETVELEGNHDEGVGRIWLLLYNGK